MYIYYYILYIYYIYIYTYIIHIIIYIYASWGLFRLEKQKAENSREAEQQRSKEAEKQRSRKRKKSRKAKKQGKSQQKKCPKRKKHSLPFKGYNGCFQHPECWPRHIRVSKLAGLRWHVLPCRMDMDIHPICMVVWGTDIGISHNMQINQMHIYILLYYIILYYINI